MVNGGHVMTLDTIVCEFYHRSCIFWLLCWRFLGFSAVNGTLIDDDFSRLTKSLQKSSTRVPFAAEKSRNLQHYMDGGECLKSLLIVVYNHDLSITKRFRSSKVTEWRRNNLKYISMQPNCVFADNENSNPVFCFNYSTITNSYGRHKPWSRRFNITRTKGSLPIYGCLPQMDGRYFKFN